MVEEIVELRPAGAHLQPIDAAEAAIVGDNDGKGDAHHRGGRQFAVHHHVAAVTDHADHVAAGIGHLDAHRPGDFVPHA